MGHAVHFLSRLERLAPREVETALALYRNTEIVREVLARAEAPEGERVALALGREPGGPHLVVTAQGDFVTCLAAGMTVGGLRVLPRAVLDAVMERRDREALADSLAGGPGRGVSLFARLRDSATLSREEMLGLSAFQPALDVELLRALVGNWMDLRRSTAACLVRGKVSPAEFELMWALTNAHGHYTALVGLTARELLERLGGDLFYGTDLFSVGGLRFGLLPSCARGLWAAARLGKERLLRSKRLLAEAQSMHLLAASAMELAVLGLGHGKLAGEARKALDRQLPEAPEWLRPYGDELLHLLGKILEAPGGFAQVQLDAGRAMALQLGERLPERSPFHFARTEDVPDELARAVSVCLPLNVWSTDPKAMQMLLAALPYLARAPLEGLYLPAAALRAWEWSAYSPELARLHVAAVDHFEGRRPPQTRAEPRLSRNAPCPCGSGKKLKRCCAAG